MKNPWKYTVFLRLVITFLLIMAPIFGIGISIYNWGVQSVLTELHNSMIAQTTFYLNGLETELQRIRVLQYDCITDDNLNGLAYAYPTMDNFNKAQTQLRLQQRLYSVKNSSRYIQDVSASITTIQTTVSALNGITKSLDKSLMVSVHDPDISGPSQIKLHGDSLYSNVFNLSYVKGSDKFAFMVTVVLSKPIIDHDLAQFNTYPDSIAVLSGRESGFFSIDGMAADQADGIRAALQQKAKGPSGVFELQMLNRKYAVVYSSSDYLGITFARCIPESAVLSNVKNYQLWFWVFSVAAVIIILLFSLSIYSFIHKPLRHLVWAFKKVEGGDFNIHIEHHYLDEFRYLYGGFNGMVKNLGTLIDQNYRQKILMQTAQLKQLQAQINPHFLYNTFFILYSMAEAEDYDSVMLFLKQLGSYFKYITRSGEDEVPLRREVEHARIYAAIQELRFSKRIKVEFAELPEQFREVMVPRLIIQPIIENAFKYGLEDKESNGILRVSFQQEGNMLRIIADDNGVGIESEEMEKLRTALEQGQNTGEITGIQNIHWRIRLLFGEGSGLAISRNEMNGLRVTITLELGGNPCIDC